MLKKTLEFCLIYFRHQGKRHLHNFLFYFTQNAVYFIIFSLSVQITSTFFTNDVLKFIHQPGCLKVKVQCTTVPVPTLAPHHKGVWGSATVAPCILKFSSRGRWLLPWRPQRLPLKQPPHYSLNRKLYRPSSNSGHSWEMNHDSSITQPAVEPLQQLN